MTGNSFSLNDLRIRKRFNYTNRILCFKKLVNSKIDNNKIPIRINIIDISYGGIGIICNKKLEKGNILIFNINEDYDLRELRLEVRWCKYHNRNYRAGLMFIDLTKDDIYFINKIIKKQNLPS